MKDVEATSEPFGMMGTLDQIIKILGFHDRSSFFATAFFLLLATAFVISCAVFLVKKRRERLDALNKIVAEAQKLPEVELKKEPEAPVHAFKEEQEAKVKPELSVVEQQMPIEPALSQEIVVKERKPKKIKPKNKKVEGEGSRPLEISIDASVNKDALVPTPIERTQPIAEEPIKEDAPATQAVPDSRHQLGAALSGTRGGFIAKLSRLFSRGTEISNEDFEELEAILFTADIGAKTAQKLLDILRERVAKEKNANKAFLRTVLKEEICRILESAHHVIGHYHSSPQVMMFVGVNGSGKTTSIGKLGAQLRNSGKKVLFGAGDTFRAAATLQLSVWAERVGADLVSGKENSDSASVLFEAIEKGKKDQVDVVLCDTAGRLHTKTSLMDELKKVHRVVGKAKDGAPHEVFLVIDATMGQNAINQAREFAAATPLTGVVLSKLDGTAKGESRSAL